MHRPRLLGCSLLLLLCLASVNAAGLPLPQECSVEPRWYCPREFELSANNICFKKERQPIKVVCQDGLVACRAGCCVVTQSEPQMVCPDGFTVDAQRGCVKEEERTPVGVCPPGFKVCTPEQKPDGGCCKATKTTRILECPADKELAGDVCTSTQDRQPTYSCPEGFHISQNSGKCARVVKTPPIVKCPDGHALDSDGAACIQSDTQPADGICPDGYVPATPAQGKHAPPPQGPCVWTREVPGQLTCPAGHYLAISPDARAFCLPTGVTLTDLPGVVDAQESSGYPGAVTPEAECPLGYSWRVHPSSKHYNDGEPGPCVCYLEEFEAYVDYTCPPATIAQGSGAAMTCRSVASVPTEQGCPKGWKEQLKADGTLQCLKWESAGKPEASCPEGMLTDAIGPPPNPAGLGGPWFVDEEFRKQTHKTCRVSSTVPPVLRCPRRSGYCPDGKNCCKLQTCPPTLTCPEGTLQDNARNPTCLVTICQDPDLICPEGSAVSGGKCVSSSNGPYSTECPAGFEQTADACERLLTAPIQPLCPDGYLYMTDTQMCACPMETGGGVQIPVVEAPEEGGEVVVPQPNLYEVKAVAEEAEVVKGGKKKKN